MTEHLKLAIYICPYVGIGACLVYSVQHALLTYTQFFFMSDIILTIDTVLMTQNPYLSGVQHVLKEEWE